MCGRLITGDMTWAEMMAIVEAFVNPSRSLVIDPNAPRAVTGFNIKPTQQVNILFPHEDTLMASTARWWLVPSWFKGTAEEWKPTTFNAKIETAYEKPTFRQAWSSGRCLVPATGYYEWSGPKNKRMPNYIRLAQNHPVMLFAGLHTQLSDGRRTCTLLTRPALSDIEALHPRMPVILTSEEAQAWLEKTASDDGVRNTFGTGWHGRFLVDPVAKIGLTDDGPELIEPIDGDGFDFGSTT